MALDTDYAALSTSSSVSNGYPEDHFGTAATFAGPDNDVCIWEMINFLIWYIYLP